MSDTDSVDDAAEARKHERTATVEEILARVRADLGRQSYPTTSEELATTYGTTTTELPNETESIGSAFDRIDEQFEDPTEAYEALVMEFEGGEFVETDPDVPAGERATWSEDRTGEEEIEGEHQRSIEAARRAQQSAAEDESDDGE
jgi:hypothetical protein